MGHDQVRKRLLSILGGTRCLKWGQAGEIARELGISRPTLRSLLTEIGATRADPVRPEPCAECGRPILPGKTGICRACLLAKNRVSLTCINCGTVFQRSRFEYRQFTQRVLVQRNRRGSVCGKACRAKVVQWCTWCGRELSPRWRVRAARYPFCGASTNCRGHAIRVLPVHYWSHFDPRLVPMKEYVNQIELLVARVKADRVTAKSGHNTWRQIGVLVTAVEPPRWKRTNRRSVW